jgi:lipoyl-dependent peroxiredoxin
MSTRVSRFHFIASIDFQPRFVYTSFVYLLGSGSRFLAVLQKGIAMTQLGQAAASSAAHIDRHLYTGKAHTIGGREGGSSRSDDGHLDVKISMPGQGAGTNPEQLFAAGWSTCFLSAIKLIAGKRKITLPETAAIDAEVDLGLTRGPDANFALAARLNVSLPGVDRQVAQELVEAAHQTCPYSRATRGNIEVALNVV